MNIKKESENLVPKYAGITQRQDDYLKNKGVAYGKYIRKLINRDMARNGLYFKTK